MFNSVYSVENKSNANTTMYLTTTIQKHNDLIVEKQKSVTRSQEAKEM